MPFPIEHTYITVIGDAYSANERWQFGFRLTPEAVSNQAAALAIAPHIETWWKGIAPYNPGVDRFTALTSHRLLEVKAATIQTDGTYPDDAPSYSHFYLPPIAGTFAPPAGTIPQATLAVTLTTAVPRGYASKGRLYLPPSGNYTPTVADGKISAALADEYANSIKRLINAINADPVIGNVAVFSRGRGVPSYNADRNRIEYSYPNPGAVNNVTGVRVGRVVDTQRRRRRQLTELPQVVTL